MHTSIQNGHLTRWMDRVVWYKWVVSKHLTATYCLLLSIWKMCRRISRIPFFDNNKIEWIVDICHCHCHCHISILITDELQTIHKREKERVCVSIPLLTTGDCERWHKSICEQDMFFFTLLYGWLSAFVNRTIVSTISSSFFRIVYPNSTTVDELLLKGMKYWIEFSGKNIVQWIERKM